MRKLQTATANGWPSHSPKSGPTPSMVLFWVLCGTLGLGVALSAWVDIHHRPSLAVAASAADASNLPVMEGMPAMEAQDLLDKYPPGEIGEASRFMAQLLHSASALDTIAKRQRYLTEKAIKSADVETVTNSLQHWQQAIADEREQINALNLPSIDNEAARQHLQTALQTVQAMGALLAEQELAMTRLDAYSLDEAKKTARAYEANQRQLIHIISQTYASYGYAHAPLATSSERVAGSSMPASN